MVPLVEEVNPMMSMVRDLWWKGFTKKVSFEFTVKKMKGKLFMVVNVNIWTQHFRLLGLTFW